VIAFGALGQRPPVRNEDFIADVSRVVGGKKARIRALQLSSVTKACVLTWRPQNTLIYVICSSGGTLETASERKARAATPHRVPGAALALTRCDALLWRCRSARPTSRRPSLGSSERRAARSWRRTSWWSGAASPTSCMWCVAACLGSVIAAHYAIAALAVLMRSARAAQEGGYSAWVARKLPGEGGASSE
jgi:Flp pilus assembly protein TadB